MTGYARVTPEEEKQSLVMCGFFGSFRRSDAADTRGCVDRLHQLQHRGPDGWGCATGMLPSDEVEVRHGAPPSRASADWFLGHHRLRIVGGREENQPLFDEASGLLLLFNGEIYNHLALRRELEGLGHSFRTSASDSEVLLRAFVAWGADCLERLQGMFAFAVWNMRSRRLFLARDRLGQKPLYYRWDREGLSFASGLSPLREPGARLDPVAVGQYLSLAYVPAPRTLVEGIQKLPPATCGWFDIASGVLTTREYWTISPLGAQTSRPPDSQIRDALIASIRQRAYATRPVGMLLSGGIDSSCVAKFLPEDGPNVTA